MSQHRGRCRDGIEFLPDTEPHPSELLGHAELCDILQARLLVVIFPGKLGERALGEMVFEETEEGGFAGRAGGDGEEDFGGKEYVQLMECLDVGLGVDDFGESAGAWKS